MADPCCNRALQSSQCCAERDVTITRRELVGVDGAQLQDRCTSDAAKLASVFTGIESFMASEENIADSQQGCAAATGRAGAGWEQPSPSRSAAGVRSP